MSTDSNEGGDNRMKKINVRVPSALLEQIEAEYEDRGYTSKSEAIRDALRSWVNPEVTLSEEALLALETSREQAERGETTALEDVAEKYDVDLDE